ncbi:hypothetical protein NBRC10513v2_005546 [Rhodotorula toruloides]
MAETTETTPEQPAPRATPAYRLAPVFEHKDSPVEEFAPYKPNLDWVDRPELWLEDWELYRADDVKEGEDRLSSLPTEILIMIISHLTPGSLLAVSRTSRFLRSLTFTKRAEPIWMAARKRRGWPDLQAGGLNEVEYAKLVEGEFCSSVATTNGMIAIVGTVDARSGETFACDIKPSEGISAEHWFLHPQTFACCSSRQMGEHGWQVSQRRDRLYFVPQVLKQSAALYAAEADAAGQARPLLLGSQNYTFGRRAFLDAVKLDASVLKANKTSLRWIDEEEEARMKEIRIEKLDEKFRSLGLEPEDFVDIGKTNSWCRACIEEDHYVDVKRWEDEQQAKCIPEEDKDAEALEDEDEDTRWERTLAEMLAAWHGNCIPAPYELTETFPFEGDHRELCFQEDWRRYRGAIIEYARRNQHKLRWLAMQDARERRKKELETLFVGLRTSCREERFGFFIASSTFLDFPKVKALWYPDNGVGVSAVELESWPRVRQQILLRIAKSDRLATIQLFDRIARSLLNDGRRLGDFASFVLDREPSPFVDSDPSKGLAPYHSALGGDDMNPVFDRLASLFRCGVCSAKLTFPDIAIHLVDEHGVANVAAYAHIPSLSFRKAVKDLLKQLCLPADTSPATFEAAYGGVRFDVKSRTKSGELETSIGETWAQVLSGKSPVDLDTNRLKLSRSTDRDIVEIKLSTAGSFDADENEA